MIVEADVTEFLDWRKNDLKKPFKTARGVKQFRAWLVRLEAEGLDVSKVLKRTMDNEWQGIKYVLPEMRAELNAKRKMEGTKNPTVVGLVKKMKIPSAINCKTKTNQQLKHIAANLDPPVDMTGMTERVQLIAAIDKRTG